MEVMTQYLSLNMQSHYVLGVLDLSSQRIHSGSTDITQYLTPWNELSQSAH